MNRTRTVAKKITYFIFSTLLLVMLILPQIRITESSAVSSKTITISQNAQSITWGGFSKTSLPTFTYSSTAIFDKSLTTFNGNDTFTFNIKANTSTSQRTGYIYAKNSSGTIIATLTVKQAAHTHSYTSWKVTATPTCTTPGSQYSICSCGNKRTATIYPMGHNCRTTKSTAATCTKKGTVTNECFRCSFTTTVTISPTGHSMGLWSITKSATCTTTGTKTRKCTRSGCTHSETEVIPKIGGSHTFNGSYTTVRESTYTIEGIKEGKCTKCGETVSTVKIPKLTPQLLGTTSTGKEVYIVKFESTSVMATIQAQYPDAIIVADDTAASNPNYQVYNSYQITDEDTINEVCEFVVNYNSSDEWTRDAVAIAGEWKEHNFLYSVSSFFNLEDFEDSAKHVDADEACQGYPLIVRFLFQ